MNDGPIPMNGQQQANQQQEQMVRKMLETAKPRSCECGCQAYEQAMAVMEVSALDPNNPTRQQQHLNYPVLCCIKCRKIFDPMGKIS